MPDGADVVAEAAIKLKRLVEEAGVNSDGFLDTPHRQDVWMLVISSFYGIDIKLYFRDHFPPHFHAYYREHSVEISIIDLSVLAGSLPRRAMALVIKWARPHQFELRVQWERARNGEIPRRIEPLP